MHTIGFFKDRELLFVRSSHRSSDLETGKWVRSVFTIPRDPVSVIHLIPLLLPTPSQRFIDEIFGVSEGERRVCEYAYLLLGSTLLGRVIESL